jgi:hypothetical protein
MAHGVRAFTPGSAVQGGQPVARGECLNSAVLVGPDPGAGCQTGSCLNRIGCHRRDTAIPRNRVRASVDLITLCTNVFRHQCRAVRRLQFFVGPRWSPPGEGRVPPYWVVVLRHVAGRPPPPYPLRSWLAKSVVSCREFGQSGPRQLIHANGSRFLLRAASRGGETPSPARWLPRHLSAKKSSTPLLVTSVRSRTQHGAARTNEPSAPSLCVASGHPRIVVGIGSSPHGLHLSQRRNRPRRRIEPTTKGTHHEHHSHREADHWRGAAVRRRRGGRFGVGRRYRPGL